MAIPAGTYHGRAGMVIAPGVGVGDTYAAGDTHLITMSPGFVVRDYRRGVMHRGRGDYHVGLGRCGYCEHWRRGASARGGIRGRAGRIFPGW